MPPARRRLVTDDPTTSGDALTQGTQPREDPLPLTQATRPQEDPPTQAADGRELVPSSSQRTDGSAIPSRSRGVARGTRVESGDGSRLSVNIPAEWNAAVGPNATRFAGEIGCRARQDLSSFAYPRWSSVPSSEKAPMVTSVKAKFNCQGLPKVVDSVINRQLATSARQHQYRWHLKYEKLVQTRGEAYARENPPTNCTIDQWTDIIDKKWTTQAFKDKSSKNKVNRSKQTLNHACGSRSLAVRAHDQMEKGELNFPQFFKDTHFNAKKKKWSTPACETKYDEIVNDLEIQSSQADFVPLTAEEMSTRYLGARSGVLKGIGMRPSSSGRSTATSGAEGKLKEEVEAQRRLIEEQTRVVEEQNRRMEQQARVVEEQKQQMEEQNQRMEAMTRWMLTMGYPGFHPPPPPPPPGDGLAGCGLAAS